MKKEQQNKLAFYKQTVTGLNEQKMTAIAGGTLTPSSTYLVTLTLQTITEKVEN